MYCEKGNPGSCYRDIEIGTTDDLLFAQNVNDVRIDNLCLKYASRFAVNFGNNKEIQVSNCEIVWIGGADFNDSIRYGNEVQFWYRGEDILVRRCLIHQVFDAALTFQGSGRNPEVEVVRGSGLYAGCQEELEQAVKYFEKEPGKVVWVEEER